ncbi:hypothetical protein [Streptomyces sp. SP18CS02]|uniref:hypothetical protein n=1 Tax=Streptomyces sp. SP18CS02 TaxID=3002531 RepID=UPI002E78E027|nr:hypothetical protein [Streptomyces sp. SP18CS02]MEE1757239.1 hypothetical protein [Streptomyces sp. SP18CS02]
MEPPAVRVLLSSRVGRHVIGLVAIGDEQYITVGSHRFLVRPGLRVTHRHRFLRNTLTVREPGRPPVVVRYRLRWCFQTAPYWEVAYDYWSALGDDPGLELTDAVGGDSDWREI